MEVSSKETLKVSYKKKLPHFSIYLRDQFKGSRWFEMEFLCGLYDPFKNHCPFLKLISPDTMSMRHCDLQNN